MLLISLLVLLPAVAARSPLLNPYKSRPHIPYVDAPDESQTVFHYSSGKQISSYGETYYFDQLIDHNDPSKGTFKQRYWHNYEFYEPGTSPYICLCFKLLQEFTASATGGPIVLGTPGETSADGKRQRICSTSLHPAVLTFPQGSPGTSLTPRSMV